MGINTLEQVNCSSHRSKKLKFRQTDIGSLLFPWQLEQLPSYIQNISQAILTVQCIAAVIAELTGLP